MVFFQAAAPSGWTKSTANNDKALRVVSGTGGGTGGTHALTSPPSTAHTHTIPLEDLNHVHNSPVVVGVADALYMSTGFGNGSDASAKTPLGTAAASVGAQASTFFTLTDVPTVDMNHQHGGATGNTTPTAFAPQYIDVIVCARD